MMLAKYGTVSYEECRAEEFVKDELMVCNEYGNEGDIFSNQPVNAVGQLAIKKEHKGEFASFKTKYEEELCEVKPFDAIFLNEDNDTGVSQSNDSDPLAIKKEDGIENAVDFEIKEEDDISAGNGEAVLKVYSGNGYLSRSENGSHSKSRKGSIVCKSCQRSKHHNLTSNVIAVPESCVIGKCRCRSVDKSNPKKPTCDKPFKCSYCGYRCSQKGTLKRHMMTHSADKPFQCSHCEYRCSQKQNLKTHMMTHSADKPFQCSHCKYRCSQKQHLKTHMMTHSADKSFQCSHCKYRCSLKQNLKSHMMTHSADKPFQCSHCEFRCYRKENLKRHMMTHSADKPF